MNFTICRLCLEKGSINNMVPLIGKSGKLSKAGASVTLFLKQKIYVHDTPLNFICQKCMVSLHEGLQFRNKCDQNHETLKSWSKSFLNKGVANKNLAKELVKYALRRMTAISPSLDNPLMDASPFKFMKVECHENTSPTILLPEETVKIETQTSTNTLESTPCSPSSSHKLIKGIKEENSPSKIDKNVGNPPHTIAYSDIINLNKAEIPINGPSLGKNLNAQKEPLSEAICEHCGIKLKSVHNLKVHLICKHQDGSLGKIFKCRLCPYTKGTNSEVLIHERSHTGERPFICNECGKSFTSRAVISKHVRSHEEKSLKCKHCPAVFNINRYLQQHMAVVHEKKYVFVCPFCSNNYNTKRYVHRHIQKHHTSLVKENKKYDILKIPRKDKELNIFLNK